MPMSRPELKQQIQALRAQLRSDPLQDAEHQAELLELIEQLEARQALETPAAPDPSLADGVNLAVERFEVSHPTLAGALRNIMQSLASMGI
jgi:hypothetical protein